jgi:hypothetical protein
MWEQDSNLDMQVIVKTEPEDKEAEDSNHDNTNFVFNNEDNCYNSSVIKAFPHLHGVQFLLDACYHENRLHLCYY